MNAVPIFVSVGAVVIAGLSAYGLQGRAAEQEEELRLLEARLLARQEVPAPTATEPSAELTRLAAILDVLENRITRLETRSTRAPVVAEEAVAAVTPAEAPPVEPTDPEEAAKRAELEQLLEMFSGSYSYGGDTEKLQRFFELARETDLIDEKIAELEAGVEADPGNVEGRMDLADTYIAKLMTIQGPEQGLWGGKAENQWREIVDLDGDHWEANFNLGNTYAYYPDVMGKTDDAIAYLRHAREVQERSTQSDEHVQTYLSLARMHQRKGEVDEARRVLEEGLRYHPGDASLEAALASLD